MYITIQNAASLCATQGSAFLFLASRVFTRRFSRPTAWASPPTQTRGSKEHALFNYTSGRWVYNEARRLQERKRVFNVVELQRLAATSVSRRIQDVLSVDKIGEGAANRVFAIHFRDGFKLIARIPYPATRPTDLVVASEAATLTFLRLKGIPVPEVYDYALSSDNPAGTPYILMEFSRGEHLLNSWHEMNEQDQHRFVSSLVKLEARLFELLLPASGSIYFDRDLPVAMGRTTLGKDVSSSFGPFCIGPSTALELWYGKRDGLDVDRGPYLSAEAVLDAGAKKEICYLEHYGKPLLPFDRMRRETFDLQKQFPFAHLESLQKYLKISKQLIPQNDGNLVGPVIRHPDLRPSNIFVSKDYEITSLIDWQNCTALPLFLQSGLPDDIDNSMDTVSQSLNVPQLPEGLAELDEDAKSEQEELFRRRRLHYLYMTETARSNPVHFKALSLAFAIGRRKIYNLACAPWQGDLIPLKSSLIFVKQRWDEIVKRPDLQCPITFEEEEERECLRLDDLEREAVEQLEDSKALLGLGPEGWVSHDNYGGATEAIAQMKDMCLEQASSEMEIAAVRDHWIYDDMDEDEYL